MKLRLGFLAVSVVVHVLIIMSLSLVLRHLPTRPIEPIAPEVPPAPRYSKVFLPPRAVLQPQPPAARPVPQSETTPPPPPARDRMSLGAPSPVRQKDLVLRRDEDLTAQPKGRPEAGSTGASTRPQPPQPQAASEPRVAETARETSGLRLPPGTAPTPSGRGPEPARAQAPSLASTLRNLEARLAREGARGVTTGNDKGVGPLDFDPQGADFTAWVNHWKNEVYRNWIVPPSTTLGGKGRVLISFTVERDGRISAISVLETSGTPALDRAAQNALLSSRLLDLPSDFGPARVTIQVRFIYNMPDSE
jgi:periplasmic protein TonB